MTSSADGPINALRSGHDRLAALVTSLSPQELSGPSAASEWSVAQVLSHLGSGAEIGLVPVQAAISGGFAPAPDFAQSIWARWNAMSPQEQSDGFRQWNAILVNTYESLDDEARNQLRIDLGYLPEPVEVAGAAAFRLHEFALHEWDVAVVRDPQAVLSQDAVGHILAVSDFMIGWIGKPALGRSATVAVRTTDPGRDATLTITSDAVRLEIMDGGGDDKTPDATLTLPAESWLRLVSGRLSPGHTPDEVTITGAVSLDELRQVFPGY